VALVRPFGSPFTARNWDRHPEMASDLVGATGFEPVTPRL